MESQELARVRIGNRPTELNAISIIVRFYVTSVLPSFYSMVTKVIIIIYRLNYTFLVINCVHFDP